MKFTFLDECGNPYVSCCKAEAELRRLREENDKLRADLGIMTAMAARNAKEEYICSTTGDLDEKQEKKV